MNTLNLNNAIFLGKKLKDFKNYDPDYTDDVYTFDTHTAEITSFDSNESKKLLEIYNSSLKDISTENIEKKYGSDFVNHLIKNNILLSSERVVALGKSREAVIWIQSNHACNLACPGCSTGMDVYQTTSRNMDKETLLKCLHRIAADSKKVGYDTVQLRLGGGEPTLRGKKWLEDVAEAVHIVEKTYNLQIPITLLSNGILATKLIHETLKNNNIECVISTDPSRVLPKVNIPTVNIVLNNIKALKEAGIVVTAQLTLGSHNADEVVEIHRKLTDMEVRITWSLFRPNDMDQYKERCMSEKVIQALYKIYSYSLNKIRSKEYYGNISDFDYLGIGVVKDGVCGAGKSYIVLDYNGDVYSCTEKMDVRGGKKQNILETDKNVYDIISEVHQVPEKLRYTENIKSDYKFKWQSGLGCPWVIKKETGIYNAQSEYMTKVYEAIAPIMISLNIEAAKHD